MSTGLFKTLLTNYSLANQIYLIYIYIYKNRIWHWISCKSWMPWIQPNSIQFSILIQFQILIISDSNTISLNIFKDLRPSLLLLNLFSSRSSFSFFRYKLILAVWCFPIKTVIVAENGMSESSYKSWGEAIRVLFMLMPLKKALLYYFSVISISYEQNKRSDWTL